MIDSLTLVRNTFSRPDIVSFTKETVGIKGKIRLKFFISQLFEQGYGREPKVDLTVFYDPLQYKAKESFTVMKLECSPRYTQKKADPLIPVISKHMNLVSFFDT